MRRTGRHLVIERELRLRGSVRVNALARSLGVSAISIRRDLAILENRGLLKRTHGGAVIDRDGHRVVDSADRSASSQKGRTLLSNPAGKAKLPVIGIVVPVSAYYYADVIAGAEEAAALGGLRLVLAVSGYSGSDERQQISRLLDLGAGGLVVAPALQISLDQRTYDLLTRIDVPVVLMERKVDFASFDAVYSEHSAGAHMVLQRLHELGHRHVALVASDLSATTPGLKRGYSQACQALSLPELEAVLLPSQPEGTPERTRILEEALDKCLSNQATAALVHSDEIAIEFTQAAIRRGLRIPGDFSIVAYDDEVAALSDPPLDAVAPPKREVGRQAVRLCAERMMQDHGTYVQRHIGLLPTLTLRASSAEPTPQSSRTNSQGDRLITLS